MKQSSGYAGRVTNKGSQEVKAPFTQPAGKTPVVKTGEDLRTGGKR